MEGFAASQDLTVGELERLSACGPAADLIDVPRLQSLMQQMPEGGWHRSGVDLGLPACAAARDLGRPFHPSRAPLEHLNGPLQYRADATDREIDKRARREAVPHRCATIAYGGPVPKICGDYRYANRSFFRRRRRLTVLFKTTKACGDTGVCCGHACSGVRIGRGRDEARSNGAVRGGAMLRDARRPDRQTCRRRTLD